MQDSFYLIVVILLFVLAISDLVVGVSNDAVNFLNSAVGARVARFKTIMMVAAAGVLVGATFSGGMMEIARNGIMTPDKFVFAEVMIIFIAVMVADVILLDTFNTFGLPTSTTVSLIFELLGASVSIALLKIFQNSESVSALHQYINSGKALEIILGILFSVAVAFVFGAVIQWISRVIFSFQFQKRLTYFGAVFGGIALSAITYFLLIKGAKGSVILSSEQSGWITHHSSLIIGISLVVWTVLFQILGWISKFNILKFVILAGTFALAMAFAGNDLVNFIGVPLAGLASYDAFIGQSDVSANEFYMTALSGPVKANSIFLIIAGLIMVVTLYTNKKARTVINTSVDLGRQDEGEERFGSNPLSRAIVRGSRSLAEGLSRIIPKSAGRFIDRQFQRPQAEAFALEPTTPSFDLVRAAVNLVVASILISIGTARKLPLSTTYVTFMVAMGTSFADRAWSRESAVYRVTGVLSVVGGWFLTAFIAFSVAFLFALFMWYTQFLGIVALMLLAAFFVFRTHILHKRREAKRVADRDQRISNARSKIVAGESAKRNVGQTVSASFEILSKILSAFINEERGTLKKQFKKIRKLENDTVLMKNNLYDHLQQLQGTDIKAGPYYIEVMASVRELVYALKFVAEPCFEHVDNNHKPLRDDQEAEVNSLSKDLAVLKKSFEEFMNTARTDDFLDLERKFKLFDRRIQDLRLKQTERVQSKQVGLRNNTLYLNLLQETRNLALQAINIARSTRDLDLSNKH